MSPAVSLKGKRLHLLQQNEESNADLLQTLRITFQDTVVQTNVEDDDDDDDELG